MAKFPHEQPRRGELWFRSTVCFGVQMVGLTTASAERGLSGLACLQRWRLRATLKRLAAHGG
jgi:hypothetical protein